LKHILAGATGNVNKVLTAESQREGVRNLSAQGHKSTPGESNRIALVVIVNSRLPPICRRAAGTDQAG